MNLHIVIRVVLVVALLTFYPCCSQKRELKVHDSNGALRHEWIFETDTLTAKKITYWPTGQVKEIHSFVNGKLDGEYLGYYSNGHIARRSHFYNNIVRGPALKFFENADSLVETETYYLDVMGKQYVYYRKVFDNTGTLISEERTFDFDCGRDSVRINFADDFPYDSVYVVVGEFADDFSFNEAVSIDTIRVPRLPISILLETNQGNVIRGKCIFFDATFEGDSIRVDEKRRWFEESVPASCGSQSVSERI